MYNLTFYGHFSKRYDLVFYNNFCLLIERHIKIAHLKLCLTISMSFNNKTLRLVKSIRKELLSRINQIYHKRSFCTTHEHYNYQNLIKRKTIYER
jgi:hypothetical protein